MKKLFFVCVLGCLISLSHCTCSLAQESSLSQAILFHAPFDGTTQAAISQGEGKLLTADAIERNKILGTDAPSAVTIAKGQGRYGDALRFAAKTSQVVFYEGIECGYQPHNWSGSVSVWLKLDPNKDLEPGYCDPLQITERAWNDAAFFVDFDKFLPRDFRLGVFADLKSWNPKDIAWDDLSVADRPMIVVKQPPFSADQWTHVCFTWKNINATDKQAPQADLFLNGKHQGTYTPPAQFTWDPQKAAIMLGINYIGLMDDLIVFSQELTADQVRQIYLHPISDVK
ncbi:MAG: LamG-like jellyroll fold domain-containing protein [Aureliella sp.]